MTLETERLILRPWKEDDAESLYKYAKNPEVGPIAGWPVHTSVENSREIIKSVLAADETYAVCLREDNVAIGSIGLITPAQSHTKAADDEIEIGYWIGVPYWGQGLIPEAVRALQKHAFLDLGCSAMWCGYYDGNEKSKRCQEKCGFKYHHTEENKPCALMGDFRTEHFTYLTKEQWSDTQDKVNFMEVKNCEKALLVIDMQNVCVGEKHARFFQYNNSDLLHEVNKVIDANENNLVIYIKNVMKKNLINKFAPFHAYEGTEDVDFAKELHIVSDNIFIKYKGNAFTNSGLDISFINPLHFKSSTNVILYSPPYISTVLLFLYYTLIYIICKVFSVISHLNLFFYKLFFYLFFFFFDYQRHSFYIQPYFF